MSDATESSSDPSESPEGKVDLTTVLYVVGGCPAIILYIVVLFFFAHACNAPA